jgi:hypothetical protein
METTTIKTASSFDRRLPNMQPRTGHQKGKTDREGKGATIAITPQPVSSTPSLHQPRPKNPHADYR